MRVVNLTLDPYSGNATPRVVAIPAILKAGVTLALSGGGAWGLLCCCIPVYRPWDEEAFPTKPLFVSPCCVEVSIPYELQSASVLCDLLRYLFAAIRSVGYGDEG